MASKSDKSANDDRDTAFARFVRLNTDSLLKTGYLLTHNGPDAEELVQDTLVWLYPRWAQVSAAENQLAYVRKALVNRFLGGRRRKSAGELHLADGDFERADPVPDASADVDERDYVWRQLATLSDRQRAAIVLRFFHDLPDEGVAELLDCRLGTVRSLISRALSTLRENGAFADDALGSYYLRNVKR